MGEKILVVCIGNELVADDAVGFEVYGQLQAIGLPPEVSVQFASVGGIALLDLLTGEESGLIVVDAVRFGAPPGTVHLIPWEEVPDLRAGAISAHTIGLRETLEIGKLLYPEILPSFLLLVGVEGRCFDRPRDAMSPEVSGAVGPAVDAVRNAIESLQQVRP